MDELKIKYRQRLFDPFVTLWAFLSQVLEPDKSCHNAVSRVIGYLAGEKVELPSTDSSAYCQARSRLPEELLQKLFGKAAQNLSHESDNRIFVVWSKCESNRWFKRLHARHY